MIILHATFINGFHVWGETDTHTNGTNWPFALSEQQILHALAETGFHSSAATLLSGQFPMIHGLPLPSSPLIGEIPQNSQNAKLAVATIPAVRISDDTVPELLRIKTPKIKDGIFYGNDILFWTQAMRFVQRLVLQQKFLPWVEKKEARWIPLLTGGDHALFRQLANAMPAYVRAFVDGVSSEALLYDFLRFGVDALLREADAMGEFRLTAHDRWLNALQEKNPRFDATPAELQDLERSVQAWAEPLLRIANFPYTVAFRLEEPTKKRESWLVRYLLQNENDPSLLISAGHLWKQKKSARQILKQDFGRAQAILLASLAQAGRIDPLIQMSMHREAPEGYETDSKGAWEFLDTKAWILQNSGYSVLLPSWWARKRATVRLGLKGRARSATRKAFAGVGIETLVQFDWKFAIGSQEITYKDLMALAKLKQPLVKFRGRWIALPPEEIASAIEFWKEKQKESGSLFDLLKFSTGAEQIGELPVDAMEAEGWVADFLLNFQEHSKYRLIDVPKSFKGELRPYQRRGYSWLDFMKTYGIGACLADDMGLGKTVQTIALLLKDATESSARAVLIVCPTSVVGNWQRELARFAPDLHVEVHHGGSRKKGEDFWLTLPQKNVIISSYALLLRDFALLEQVKWRGVILDEAQNIKNAETKQAQAARSLQADYRFALTGTPIENNVGELWSIMEFLNKGLLGNRTEFYKKYFLPIHSQQDSGAMEELKRITHPFVLRRLKSDPQIISDLPKKMEMKVFCNLTKEQGSLYAAVVRDLDNDLKDAEGIQRRGKILAALTRLKQICNHPAHFLGDGSTLQGRSGKLARLVEMLEEIVELGERSLIFTQFAEMGTLLQGYLQNYFGREALFLHGGVMRKRREEMVERFQNDDDAAPFFILSLKAGGTGLNLTRASHVFHFDRWWNPAVEDQATDRAYRIGQKKNVQVHKFVCVGTLEERIDELLMTKKELADTIVGTGESWLTELSTSEIKSLVALSQDAVAV